MSESRTVSNPASEGQASRLPPFVRPTSNQQSAAPALPRNQTAAPSYPPRGAPSLDLQIPSPSLHNVMQGFGTMRGAIGPGGRRLSNSMTWPAQSSQHGPGDVAAGYPYSAPPMDSETEGTVARPYLPPTPDQLARLNRRAEAPRQLSGGFQVQRVPVGSRASGEYRRTSFQRPSSQQQWYAQQQADYHEPRSQSQPQDQYGQTHLRSHGISPGTPQEDVPLIISTPKGVSGAFDPPDRRTSGRRAETPILAPVPRHPRPSTQAAVLRPGVERLETIYSVASAHVTQAAGLLAPPIAPGSGSGSSNMRVASLNRKQSRAERSAAKNIADAKRRGWRARSRSKSKRKKAKTKERELDAASSAAWTDITALSGRSLGFGRGGVTGLDAAGQLGKGDRKCIIM